jgi:hypothetical protein
MLHRVLTATLLGALVSLSGCGPTQYWVDAGTESDGALPTGALAVESEPALALVFGERADLEVRYTEAGAPVADVPIRFALDGLAHDSTLAELTVTADAEGRTRTQLTAGSTSTVFRVRVSAPRAAPVYVEVSVGNMGFGSLRVAATYEGPRRGTRRVVRVYPSLGCADELLPGSALSVTLDDPTTLEARFRALPAGLSYAVVGELQGPSGTVLSRACVDGVEVTRETESSVTLAFEDLPLALAGDYDAAVQLDLAATGSGLSEALALLGTALIEAAGSDAGLYLDALERALRESGALEAADALVLERSALASSLTARLGTEGATRAVLAWVGRLQARFANVEAAGPLRVMMVEGAPSASWTIGQLAFGVEADPDSPPLRIDPATTELPLSASMTLAWTGDDVGLEPLKLTLPLGAWVGGLLQAEARAAGLDETSALLHEGAGCDAFADWVADTATLAAACDGTCAIGACHDALATVFTSLESSLVTLDEGREAVELFGAAPAVDEDGDLLVDALSADALEGRFASELDPAGDPATGTLTAVRAPPAE